MHNHNQFLLNLNPIPQHHKSPLRNRIPTIQRQRSPPLLERNSRLPIQKLREIQCGTLPRILPSLEVTVPECKRRKSHRPRRSPHNHPQFRPNQDLGKRPIRHDHRYANHGHPLLLPLPDQGPRRKAKHRQTVPNPADPHVHLPGHLRTGHFHSFPSLIKPRFGLFVQEPVL